MTWADILRGAESSLDWTSGEQETTNSMANKRTYPDGYTHEWLDGLAANGEPVEPGYDGIVFVLPAQLLRVVIEGDEQDVIITAVTRHRLGRLSADAIDSDGNFVALPPIDPSGEIKYSLVPVRRPTSDQAREVGRSLAQRSLGSTLEGDSADPG